MYGPYEEVLPDRNLEMYKETIEDRKNISGGFHPHLANRRILEKFLSDKGWNNQWKTTTHSTAQLGNGIYTSTCTFMQRGHSKLNLFFHLNQN